MVIVFLNRIVLLLRASGGIWPCETPATALTSDMLTPTVHLYGFKDEKMCESSSCLRRAISFIKNEKVVFFMKSLHELFTELDYWENYKPVNMPSSMVKVQHVQSIKREIVNRIDVHKYKDIILENES